MQMTPEDLQVQLDLLETQQLGLERQGVLIEQMIRDKCEGKLISAPFTRLSFTPYSLSVFFKLWVATPRRVAKGYY